MKKSNNEGEHSEGSRRYGKEGIKDEKAERMEEKNKSPGQGHGSHAEDRDEEGQTKEDKIADDAGTSKYEPTCEEANL
jgi:hypothetical protein